MNTTRKIFILLMMFFLFFSLSPSSYNQTYAKTKKQEQYEQFKKIKMNSSVESVSKVLYGKSYKKKICDRYEDDLDNIEVNLLCYEEMFESNVFYKNGKLRYLKYSFDLFPDKPFPQDSRPRMGLTFKSNDKSKVLKLVEKYWYDSSVTNTQKVINNKRIKTGMTKRQLDSIMTGKGIGKYSTQTYVDYSKIAYQEGNTSPIFYSQYKVYSYVALSQNMNILYLYDMEYDNKLKEMIVSYVTRYKF